MDWVPYLSQDVLSPYLGDNVLARGAIAFIPGACIGSFLNVVAMRSLLQKSWWRPRSHCLKCQKPIAPFDMIPILSYFILKGRCRSCKETISWQYPLVEAVTGVIFALVLLKFGFSIDGLAMCVFASTLIAVTITDFREKLIPHEITYPSILIGLGYYWLRHGSPADALIGAGISYILFDFIDFYGLVAIQHMTKEDDGEPSPGATPFLVDRSLDLKEPVYNPDDDIVMGGGDAVMSALIGCWLGWQQMAMAVVIAFIMGSALGAIYLLFDMHRRSVLSDAIKPAIKGFALGFFILAVPIVALGYLTQTMQAFINPQLIALASFGGVAGALMFAVLSNKKRFTNRFPFGPALAIGGLTALLLAQEGWYLSQPLGIINPGGGY